MGSKVHNIIVLEGENVRAQRKSVPHAQLNEVLVELRALHSEGAQFLVDGEEVRPKEDGLARRTDQTPAKPKRTRTPVTIKAEVPGVPPVNFDDRPEWKGVQLAHHMLWHSYERAAEIQAQLLCQNAKATLENNRKVADLVEDMQHRFQAAMQKIDVMAFEHKMLEHEAAGRRLAAQARRAEIEARRADESPLDWLEGAMRGLSRALTAFGEGSDDPN